MIKILFVCHGNICRSPMAEFVMKKMVRDLPTTLSSGTSLTAADFEIASAATSTEEIGNPVYPPARRMLARHNIDCSGKTARQMTYADYEHYDYIVLMDQNILRTLRWIPPRDIYERETGTAPRKISLLMEWAGKNRDVADPWYTGDFEATWRDVNEGCKAMLTSICK
jgi:protein-tyrosine phosphatase